MPVVLVLAAPLPSEEAMRAALSDVNSAVASGLGLRPEDVYSAHGTTSTAMLGSEAVSPWPVAVVYGSARAPERMEAALAGLRHALATTWSCAEESVWAQWVVSQ